MFGPIKHCSRVGAAVARSKTAPSLVKQSRGLSCFSTHSKRGLPVTRPVASTTSRHSVFLYSTQARSTIMPKNFEVVLLSRPGANGVTQNENFGYAECPYPSQLLGGKELEKGHVVIRTLYLSVDPAQRCMLNEDTGVEYALPIPIRGTMNGFGGIGVIEASNSPNYQPGELVYGMVAWPWRNLFIFDAHQQTEPLLKVPESLKNKSSVVLTVLTASSGLTALYGVKEKGHVTSGANQTFVVNAAAGSVGSLAGQIAKLEGCGKVIGICGGAEKCTFLKEELGFDAAIDYKGEDVEARLRETAPNGIDIYFDNVGGKMSDTVFKQMNRDSHVILCGQIADYNTDAPYPPPVKEELKSWFLQQNITRDRYLVLDYMDKYESGLQQLGQWLQEGKLKYRETVWEGLENSGRAFVSMMNGGNIGKTLVRVGNP